MSLNKRGISVYTIISIVLFFALIFILALPSFFNLDKSKNEEDCINNMKLIWVAASDYMKDNLTAFSGDLSVLTSNYKKTEDTMTRSRSKYLEKLLFCPENRGSKEQYIVFSMFLLEDIQGTQKLNYGTIVVCPNLTRYPRHMIPKSFYENMEPTELQNYFIDDLEAIDVATGVNGKHKLDLIKTYINIWKTDTTALSRIRVNNMAIRDQVMPKDEPDDEPIIEEVVEEE